MPSLADLFVTYKSIPEPERYTEDTTDIEFGDLASLDVARNRLRQISSSKPSIQQDTTDNDQDDLFDNDEDEMDDKQFSWYVASLYKPASSTDTSISISSTPSTSSTTSNSSNTSTSKSISRELMDIDTSRPVVKYNRGKLDEEIAALFRKYKINVRITSGKREAGAAGKAGSSSHHVGGNAADIVPGEGETFESIRKKMLETPEIKQFFYENGLGVLDETDPKVMAKTGATGKHYHIGPDISANKTWAGWLNGTGNTSATNNNNRQEWTRNTYDAFRKGLKDEFGNKYNDDTYNRIATYMTYQSALESGYGEHANGFNYGGHMRNGKTIHYDTMDAFVKAHIKTLKKWDFMNAKSLEDYVNSLYVGNYQYNTSDSPTAYYTKINGTSNTINGYLGLSAKFGGKFTNVRQLYEKGFD